MTRPSSHSNFGGRVDAPGCGEFIEYAGDEQFAPLARTLAMVAAERAQRDRALLPTIEATAASSVTRGSTPPRSSTRQR
jgi:hypothetical protein